MSRLQNRSGGGTRDSEKYFISCKDPQNTESWLRDTDVLQLTQTQAVIQALISDGVARKQPNVVIKMGSSDTIRKEYDIGEKLRDIPGFMHFICLMQCHDKISRYEHDRHSAVCSNDPNDPLNNVLVMSYIPGGSMREYAWHTKDSNLFRSCLKQLVLSLYIAFLHQGFVHTDIHLDNVLIKMTRKATIQYSNEHQVETCGLAVCIMDFEKAFMPVDRSQTHAFWDDIAHVFNDIRYAMKLRFSNQHEIETLLLRVKHGNKTINIKPLLDLIDDISRIEKQEIRMQKYDPNVL